METHLFNPRIIQAAIKVLLHRAGPPSLHQIHYDMRRGSYKISGVTHTIYMESRQLRGGSLDHAGPPSSPPLNTRMQKVHLEQDIYKRLMVP